jgi:succinyl-diaminopimelate desuccinylase
MSLKTAPESDFEKVSSYLCRHEGKLLKFLQDLIQIPTVNPPGDCYKQCVSYLDAKLKSMGMKTQVHRVPINEQKKVTPHLMKHPRYNLIGRWNNGAAKTLHFNAHYDVVPVSGEWKYGPFVPRVDGGSIYGRGAADMKGAIAACCFAIQAVKDCKQLPGINVEVSFTADEETGGELGAGYIVNKKLVNPDYAVICEGGSGRTVGCGHNGVLWLECVVTGKSAHAAHPHKGINAFEHMSALVVRLNRWKKNLKNRSYISPNGRKMHPTINIGGVFEVGLGAKVNTVPSHASFSIDRRIIPSDSLPGAEREIKKVINEAKRHIPDLRVKTSSLLAIKPCLVDHQSYFPQTVSRVVSSVLGGRTQFNVCDGFTDMNRFVNNKIITVGYGPGGKYNHGVDERAKVRDILQTARVYAKLILSLEEKK